MALLEALVDTTPVQSSNLVSYGYNPALKTLAVWTHSGDLFHYHGVPPQLWEAFQKAPSKGKFYGMAVRGKFAGVRMTGKCPDCGAIGLVGLKCEDCGCSDVVAVPPKPRRVKAPTVREGDVDRVVEHVADAFPDHVDEDRE